MAGYDETPYPSDPLPEAQPDRLAAVARLHGLTPASPRSCRVLELGCADGGNLRAAALAAPEAEHVGVDLSAEQVAAGRRAAEELGLANLRLVHGDARDVARLGRFDFVIVHGVYSWVPPSVQQALLAAIGAVLAPDGVAYLSYNTRPGHALRGAVHAMLRRQTRGAADPVARAAAARELLDLLSAAAPPDEVAYRAVVEGEVAFLRSGEHDPAGVHAYITHEVLADDDHPVWFADLVADAAAHGLRYVADAEPHAPTGLAAAPDAARRALAAVADPIEREQLGDCLLNRAFRRSLLCRAERSPTPAPSHDAVRSLVVASTARPEPDGAGFARRHGGRVDASTPLARAALTHLLERFPEAVAFDELLARVGRPDDADALARLLLAACAADVLDLRASPPPCVAAVSARPVASPLARRAARLGQPAFNAHQQRVPLPPAAALLLPALDGTRDAAALRDLLSRHTEPASAEALAGTVDGVLRFLARAGLLVA